MIWASPQYTPQPYQLRTEALELTQVEIIYEEIEPPEVAPPPVIPPEIDIVSDDDPGAVDLPELDGKWDIFAPPPVVMPSGDEGFVASSTKPQLISQAKPHYPEVARLARIEGTVIVKVFVGVDGSVQAADIVKGVHPLLNNAALKAAGRCTFAPGLQRGVKVATWVAVPYNFKLE